MCQRTMLLIAPNAQGLPLTQRALEQVGPHHTMQIVRDGEAALAYLLRQGPYTDPRRAPTPKVIRTLAQPSCAACIVSTRCTDHTEAELPPRKSPAGSPASRWRGGTARVPRQT